MRNLVPGLALTQLYSSINLWRVAVSGASLVSQTIKNLPAMQETWVRFLAWEDSLEKETATQSSIFFFFNYLFILLYIVLVLPYTDMNLPWVYMCSPS